MFHFMPCHEMICLRTFARDPRKNDMCRKGKQDTIQYFKGNKINYLRTTKCTVTCNNRAPSLSLIVF